MRPFALLFRLPPRHPGGTIASSSSEAKADRVVSQHEMRSVDGHEMGSHWGLLGEGDGHRLSSMVAGALTDPLTLPVGDARAR